MSRPGAITIALSAIRPQTLPAAAAPVVVGGALARSVEVWRAGPWLAALVGALLIQIFANLFNDYADYKKGADTDARLGPARVTQKGWLRPEQVLAACALTVVLTLLIGAYLTAVGGWPILAIGLVSLFCGWLYTGGPAPLAYSGLGDLFVLLFFGLVAVGGTYFLLTGSYSLGALYGGLIIGLPITAILVVNNLRDAPTDAAVGKRTLVVRFGPRFGRVEYRITQLGGYGVAAIAAATGALPAGALLVFAALPLAWLQVRRIDALDGAALNPMLGATAKHGLLMAALLSVGVLL